MYDIILEKEGEGEREGEGGREVEIVRILLDLFVDSLWLVGMFGCAK